MRLISIFLGGGGGGGWEIKWENKMFAEIKSIMNLLKREKLKCITKFTIPHNTVISKNRCYCRRWYKNFYFHANPPPPPPSREITVHFTSSAATESKSRLYALTSSQRIPLVPGLHKHFPVARSQLSVFLGLQSHRWAHFRPYLPSRQALSHRWPS